MTVFLIVHRLKKYFTFIIANRTVFFNAESCGFLLFNLFLRHNHQIVTICSYNKHVKIRKECELYER